MKIGIGVIGTGFARKTQIPGFAILENAELVSVSSGTLENAADTAKEFSIAHYSDNWRETVRRPDVDLVCITTPPDLHLEMTLEALKNGKHVLCEKPMAMNTAEAVRMANVAGESGLLALIDHEMRFTNGRLKAFEMIRDGAIGKIRHAKYLFCNSARGNVALPWTWWSDVAQGGGSLGAIGSHVIDTFRWFLDTEIEDVHCRLQTHIKQRPHGSGPRPVTTDDEALLTLRFSGSPLLEDATAVVSISMIEAGPYRNRVEFFGTKGAMRIEDGGEIFIAEISAPAWESVDLDLGRVADGMQTGGWSRGFTVFAERIVETLLREEVTFEHAPSFADGVAIQQVLDAARESNVSGSIVAIPGNT